MAQSAVTGRVGPDLLSAFGPRELEHTKTREKERARERERERVSGGRAKGDYRAIFVPDKERFSPAHTHTKLRDLSRSLSGQVGKKGDTFVL